jgi:hypothetical protein
VLHGVAHQSAQTPFRNAGNAFPSLEPAKLRDSHVTYQMRNLAQYQESAHSSILLVVFSLQDYLRFLQTFLLKPFLIP